MYLRNARAVNADGGDLLEQHSEYVAKLNYGIQATRWLNVMPNLQYVEDSDAFTR